MKKRTIVQKSIVETQKMTRIPNTDLESGYKDLSRNAFKLLTYYFSKGDGWKFSDNEIAETLRVKNTRTIAKARKELITKEYLLIYKGTVDNYFVGKKKVFDFKQ